MDIYTIVAYRFMTGAEWKLVYKKPELLNEPNQHRSFLKLMLVWTFYNMFRMYTTLFINGLLEFNVSLSQ